MLLPGDPAPAFVLMDQDERLVSLDDLRGSWVVLWWFPKASTNGCTREGQGFRDRIPQFDKLRAKIVGASFDTPADNKTFATAQQFGFPLLCDVDHEVGRAYDVERGPDENNPHYPKRVSFLIDPEGVIARVYEVSDAGAHPEVVLEDLGRLVSPG